MPPEFLNLKTIEAQSIMNFGKKKINKIQSFGFVLAIEDLNRPIIIEI
jgi:hypothetical protein